MFVSVIIPSYNKEKRLRLVLQTLVKQNCGADKFEVIVVNDGSTDNTSDTVMSFRNNTSLNITHIYQQNKGRAAARNTGIKAAKGDIFLFLDDDRLVGETFISEHLRLYLNTQDKNLVVLGKRVSLFFSRFEESYECFVQLFLTNPEEILKKAREEFYWKKVKPCIGLPAISWMLFVTGNVSLRVDLLEKVGLFNEGFRGWGYEDTELGYRLWLKGAIFVSSESAINYHLEHARNQLEWEDDIERNQGFFLKIHPEFPMQYFNKFLEGKINLEQVNQLITSHHPNLA